MTMRNCTFAEWRTAIANRVFGGTRLLGLISSLKWALYPHLVRHAEWLATAIHEPESTRAYCRAIRPGMLVVDGGANMGGYSMLASRRVGASGTVFAFEPEPRNFERLSRRMPSWRNVVVVPEAIAGYSGEASLHLDTFHAGHSLRELRTDESVAVPVTTLDDFVRAHGLPGLDVVKLDIEGAELDAIDGMRMLLSGSRRPVIVCEVHPPITPEEIRDALAVSGYRSRLLDAELTGGAHEVPVHLLDEPPERQ